MEISDPNLIQSLLADVQRPRCNQARKSADCYEAPAGKRMRRNCRCGRCRSCLDNARWERIFQEKFADPEYNNRPLNGGSSLKFT
jgi:hypothetical protein